MPRGSRVHDGLLGRRRLNQIGEVRLRGPRIPFPRPQSLEPCPHHDTAVGAVTWVTEVIRPVIAGVTTTGADAVTPWKLRFITHASITYTM